MSNFDRYGLRPVPTLVAIVAVLAAAGFAARQAEAAVTTFEVEMIGANEVPAASSPGSGFARFTFDDQTRVLTYSVWMRGLSSNQVTASHIHRAPPGVAGPAVYTLSAGPFDTVSGSITLTEADVADLRAGNLYVNIHSTANPAGFARGQLRLSAAPAAPAAPAALPRTGDGGFAEAAPGTRWAAILLAGAGAAAASGLAVRALRRS
jgi:hypothetical protein